MHNHVAPIFALLLIGSFAFVAPISYIAMALPLDYLDRTYIFGPIAGITEDENDSTEWVLAGVWRASLPNSTDISNNNTNGTTFNAAIDMIRPDGTARHTHTLTAIPDGFVKYCGPLPNVPNPKIKVPFGVNF